MNPGDFRFWDSAGAEQFARILRRAIERARGEKVVPFRRGGQHSPPRLDDGDGGKLAESLLASGVLR